MDTATLEIANGDLQLELQESDREKSRVAKGILSQQILQKENKKFAGTAGISENNRGLGFVPAFFDTDSGRVELSRFEDGREAPIHLLEGIPADWVLEQDSEGNIRKTKPGIVAGFVFQGRFYTREEAAVLLES